MRRFRSAFLVIALFALCATGAQSLDQARLSAGVDAAVAQFGVSGRGVIVALLDRGIDWKNQDFRNGDGTTRIAYIFDLTDDTGAAAPGNSYGIGTIYTRSQIDQALAAGTALATRDAVGHGTTTAAIAAGNGRNSTARKYRGVAPEATIIAVKVTSDGVPAHDGEPAEAAFYKPERLPAAIDFVRDKARELGLPAVMLLNLGSQGGPTDGTSDLARKIDATVGPGIPGLVFVTGPGDDGGMANRAGGSVPQSGSAAIQIQKGNGSVPLVFDLWYPGVDRFNVSIQSPSGTFGPYASPVTNSDSNTQQTSDFLYRHQGSAVTFNGAQNGKREIRIRLDGPAGTYTVTLVGASVTNGRFDATLNPSDIVAAYSTNRFLTYVAPGSIWDGAAARNNICPNAYVNKTNWTDIDGVPRSLTGEGSPGEIWKGSSIGPTFDGRLGVDLSAPGTDLVTAYNPTSYWATFRFNLINDGGGLYGIAGAVSAAAPLTTGVIALMLQANPSLDASQVRQILQQTARSSAVTGTTPNTTWGYGKIDAQAAVLRAVTSPCTASVRVQCMNNNRFRVQVYWRVPSQGVSGIGTAVPLTSDTGYFWFFSDNNVELVIKVVDGRAVNNRFWVFYGALSDVEYLIRVTDTVTGTVRIYQNPQGNLASVADTSAFEGSASVPETSASSDSPLPSPAQKIGGEASCSSGPVALCLNSGRFRVDVSWRVPSQGTSGAGSAVALTGDTGYFWFFSSNNVELVIKVVDGRVVNNHFWVFYGALSDVEYSITVTDTTTGAAKTYFNPSGNLASVADVSAF